jgi:hypothetical protein
MKVGRDDDDDDWMLTWGNWFLDSLNCLAGLGSGWPSILALLGRVHLGIAGEMERGVGGVCQIPSPWIRLGDAAAISEFSFFSCLSEYAVIVWTSRAQFQSSGAGVFMCIMGEAMSPWWMCYGVCQYYSHHARTLNLRDSKLGKPAESWCS